MSTDEGRPGTVLPLSKGYPGQKVEQLGLHHLVFQLLLDNWGWRDITYACNERLKDLGSEDTVDISTIKKWLRSQGEKMQQTIRESQSKELLQEVWDFERAAMKRREEMIDIMKAIIPEPSSLTQEYLQSLPVKEKRLIVESVQTLRDLQESGEKFMGIGSKAGNRYGTQTDSRDDLLERVKEVLQSGVPDMKDVVDLTFEDEEYETIDEAQNGNKTNSSVSSKDMKKLNTDL